MASWIVGLYRNTVEDGGLYKRQVEARTFIAAVNKAKLGLRQEGFKGRWELWSLERR